MSLFRIKIALLFLFLGPIGFSQLMVKDTAFAKYLCQTLPERMDSECTNIIDTSIFVPGDINLFAPKLGITSIDEAVYFPEFLNIFASENKLRSVPELSEMPWIKKLIVPENEIVTAPNINYSGNEELSSVVFRQNKLSSLPGWEAPNPFIDTISIRSNELTAIPSFEGYSSLTWFRVFDNRLSFNYLIPIYENPFYIPSEWRLFPQKKFAVPNLTIEIDKVANLEIPNAYQTDGNTYYLIREGEIIDSTREVFFELKGFEEVAGTYELAIRNDAFLSFDASGEDPVINSEEFKVELGPAIFVATEDLIVKEGEIFDLSLPEQSLVVGDTYYLFKNGILIDSSLVSSFHLRGSLAISGAYTISVKNPDVLSGETRLQSEPFVISVLPAEEPIKDDELLLFSPNGDGLHDDLYIDGAGEFSIYSLEGELELKGELPFLWNGKTSSGASVPNGLHYIRTANGVLKVMLSY